MSPNPNDFVTALKDAPCFDAASSVAASTAKRSVMQPIEHDSIKAKRVAVVAA